MRSVMRRYFAEMGDAVAAHGGSVAKFVGDAVVAVFGLPTLHEDDALRAVKAATAMRERVTQVNPSQNELEHTWPVFLPDGRHFLYLARNAQPENSAIYVG